MIDITRAHTVEIKIRDDGRVVWINVDEECVLRVYHVDKIVIDDLSKKLKGEE